MDVLADAAPLVRLAEPRDESALRELIARSFSGLAGSHYDAAQIAAALGSVIRLDLGLIEDRTYFAVEQRAQLVACGGFSTRLATIPGASLDGHAEVRAMFVTPEAVGQGLGKLLLRHVEAELARRGHTRSQLVATLCGVAFYERAGYATLEDRSVELPGGVPFPLRIMARELATPSG